MATRFRERELNEMIEELKTLAKLIDYPVTVAAFVWALRMIQKMHGEIVELLKRCLDEQYDPEG